MPEPGIPLAGMRAGGGLRIERISYLASGRKVAFTRSIYRGEGHDVVAGLRLGDAGEGQGVRA